MFGASFSASEFLNGVSGAFVWLFFAFLAWWIMFRAPLGRRVFRRRISIGAPAEKVWSASLFEPSPPGGWAGFIHIIEQSLIEGAPLRHKTIVAYGGRRGKTRILISRIIRVEPCAWFESEYETIDGAAVVPADAVRGCTRLEEKGGVTLLELEISQPVKGVFGHLSTGRIYERYLAHLRAHCEGREAPRPQPLIGRSSAAWLAVAAVGASAVIIGTRNPDLGWLCVLIAVCIEIAVLVHEYGHFLAMRWFGHRDASVLFIPFFGGATLGARPLSSRYEQAMIALAGPAISALAVLPLTPLAHWGLDAAQSGARDMKALVGFGAVLLLGIAVPMNLLNLAPIGMLDGGKVVDALARGRGARLLIMSAIFAALGFSLTASESLTDLGYDVAVLAVVWVYELMTAEKLEQQLEPMSRNQLAATLAALALTFIVYVDASRTLLPAVTAALQNSVDALAGALDGE